MVKWESYQDGCVIVQVIEEEVDCLFDEISKPGPISALKNNNKNYKESKHNSQPTLKGRIVGISMRGKTVKTITNNMSVTRLNRRGPEY